MSAEAVASGTGRIWPIGVALFGGAFLLGPTFDAAGAFKLIIPALAVGALLVCRSQPDRIVFGVPLARLRPMMIWFVGFTLLQAAILFSDDNAAQLKTQAGTVVALGNTDASAQAKSLAEADEDLLTAIGAIDPALRDREVARRGAAKAASDAATAAATEAANKGRIANLIAEEKKLDRSDLDGRIAVWEQIASLAPPNGNHQLTLGNLKLEKEAADNIREHPEQGVEVVSVQGRKDGFGSVLILDITLRNTSGVALRDFIVNCEHSANSGTVMDSNSRTLYERLAAGETRKFRKVNMGFIQSQAVSTNCEVGGATVG